MFDTLAAAPEWAHLCRYDLLGQKTSLSFKDRWFRRAKNAVARFGLVRPHVTAYPWLATLKHAQPHGCYKVLLIWALGVERDDLRAACEGFLKRLDPASGIVPVLVTDLADFAFFSRLKWLVEYLPDLNGEGLSYRERKVQYLAWRYQDALVVPASAGQANEIEWQEVMEMKC
jgi:hypothetical protein